MYDEDNDNHQSLRNTAKALRKDILVANTLLEKMPCLGWII